MDEHKICSGSQPEIFCEQDSTEFIDHHHVLLNLMNRKATDATPMIAKTQGPAPTHHKLFHILEIGKGKYPGNILVISWSFPGIYNSHDVVGILARVMLSWSC